ncbi:MAG TPA: cytochrome c oxidase assembly protein [Streptosporangiaceae bacterium]|nr:cytochrome c oxidase assembly protein [Streptosporangiaceae bacterium]
MLPPFGLSAVATQWQFAPIVTAAVVAAAGLYGWGVLRVARRHRARPWPAWRTGMFMGGLAMVVIATQSGIGAYDDLLFYDHMVQHLILIMVAPPLLIFGQPITLLLHASRNPLHTWAKRVLRSRVATFLTWPVFGALAYAAAIVGAHLSGLANLVERNQTVHNLEHALFLVVGYLFFLPILGQEPIRWKLSYPVRFVVLVLIMPIDTFTGLALGNGGASSPGVPTGLRPAWAPSPVQDLHLGGAVMWVAGDGLMFVLMMVVFLMWSTDDRATSHSRGWFELARRENLATLVASHQASAEVAPASALPEGRGGIDDDEHLAAYNAYLARLNQPPPGPAR